MYCDGSIWTVSILKGSFQIFGAIRCPRYSLTIIWLKIKHFEKQIVFVDLAVNTPLKLVGSYCDNAPISSVLVLRSSQIWKYVMSHERWMDCLYVISRLFSCFIVLKLFSVTTYYRTSKYLLLSDCNVLVFGTY